MTPPGTSLEITNGTIKGGNGSANHPDGAAGVGMDKTNPPKDAGITVGKDAVIKGGNGADGVDGNETNGGDGGNGGSSTDGNGFAGTGDPDAVDIAKDTGEPEDITDEITEGDDPVQTDDSAYQPDSPDSNGELDRMPQISGEDGGTSASRIGLIQSLRPWIPILWIFLFLILLLILLLIYLKIREKQLREEMEEQENANRKNY